MFIVQELHTKSAFLCCLCFAMFVILRDQYKRLASAALSMLMGCFCPRRTHPKGVRQQLGVRGQLAGPEGSHAECWQRYPGRCHRRP